MKGILAAVFFAALTFTASAASAECRTVDTVVEEMKAGNPGIEIIARLDGQRAADFMDAVNSFIGSARPEREILIMGGPRFLSVVVLFQDGCVTKYGKFPPHLVDAWLEQASG